jgi:hypothetical protein
VAIGAREWSQHAEVVGRITLAWNAAVYQLLRVFTHLTGLDSPYAEAIFFSHRSDQGQRLLIRRIVNAVELPDPYKTTLEKLLKRLDKVATDRNLAAHTPFGISLYDPQSGQWGARVVAALTPPHDPRLKQDFDAQFRKAEEELSVVGRELNEWIIHSPYPPRPWGSPIFVGTGEWSAPPQTYGLNVPGETVDPPEDFSEP